ncbi:hypothetical protein ACF09H_26195 [Streptomyces sp. NPDC014983]|uniref:hypothetical protein n=1 Tax=Streptomyces sp. NPDC014983 TaxID=3364933 RepID=UPI0036F4E4BD
MQGHGYRQPAQPPHPAVLVLLRVLFVAIGFLSLGFLAWVMQLRLASVTRRSLDWGLFVAAQALDALSVVLLGSEPGDEVHTAGGYTGIFLLFGTLAAATGYYLVAEIRHYARRRREFEARRPIPAYGYPGPAAAYAAPAAPVMSGVPTPPPVAPHTPVPGPPPPHRPAARIDQVRAELDELSDYLRQHDGRSDGQLGGDRPEDGSGR